MEPRVELTERLAQALLARGWMLVTAESCTGGMVAEWCTSISGSSRWFFGGFVTYDNRAKMEWLGVREETLRLHGAVSEQTVREMVDGALSRSPAQAALAISGIAGPTGGTPDKPVGTVWIGWGIEDRRWAERFHFDGDRDAVRRQAAQAALEGLSARLQLL